MESIRIANWNALAVISVVVAVAVRRLQRRRVSAHGIGVENKDPLSNLARQDLTLDSFMMLALLFGRRMFSSLRRRETSLI